VAWTAQSTETKSSLATLPSDACARKGGGGVKYVKLEDVEREDEEGEGSVA